MMTPHIDVNCCVLLRLFGSHHVVHSKIHDCILAGCVCDVIQIVLGDARSILDFPLEAAVVPMVEGWAGCMSLRRVERLLRARLRDVLGLAEQLRLCHELKHQLLESRIVPIIFVVQMKVLCSLGPLLALASDPLLLFLKPVEHLLSQPLPVDV